MSHFKGIRSAVCAAIYVVGGGLFLPSLSHATFSGSDDFSSSTPDWNRWNFDGGEMSAVGGEAVFTSATPAGGNDQSQWQWNKNTGSADESWSLRIDVKIAPANGSDAYTSSWMTVYKGNGPSIPYSDTFRVSIRGDGLLYADFWHEYGYVDWEYLPTTSTEVSLGIEYDAATRTLTAAYDPNGAIDGYSFQPFFSVSDIDWITDDPFVPIIGSQAGNFSDTGTFAVTSGMMSFDNFQTSGNPLPVAPVPEPITTIAIDIKPGNDPNSINLCSNGAVPVAILGSDTFDVSNVNTETLRFAGASVKVVGKKNPKAQCGVEDVNSDVYVDLVCHFVTADIAGINGESVTATVNGELLNGTEIEGTDSVNIVKATCN